jgi:sec-independent protein translocase protein TatA
MAVFGLPGGAEWWIILGIILLLFGPTQLPKLAKMFGKSAKALKEGLDTGLNEPEEGEQKDVAPKAQDSSDE